MDAVLLLVALAVLLAGGAGLALGLSARRPVGRLELLGLAILLGAGIVSLASFWLGRLLLGWPLRLSVTAICLALLVWGLSRRPPIAPPSSPGALAALAVVATTAIVTWLSVETTLGWDGLVVWEMKARIAALAGGRIPVSYFSEATRQWSHPYYPLLVPMNEWWIYAWTGRIDQTVAKYLFPVLYLGGAAVLQSAARRLGGPWCGWVAVALLVCVPEVLAGDGGAPTGYADFPLALFYVAAISYTVEYATTGSRGALALGAALATALPWIKQEGILAFAGACAVAFIATGFGRRYRDLAAFVVPGALVFVAWRVFLVRAETPSGAAFLPFALPTLIANASRVPVIAMAVLTEFRSWIHWSYLWPAALLGAAFAWPTPRRHASLLLVPAILVPLGLSSAAYIMSAWNPFELHVVSSLPRLVLQVAPVAVLLAVVGLVPRR